MESIATVWATPENPSSGKGKAVDVDVSLWVSGMLVSLALFAVKVGLGLGFGGLRRRQIVLIYAMYFALFIGAACSAPLFTGALERVPKAGPYLHILVGTVMIAWGILALRWFGHNAERPGVSRHAWIFAMPCPACLIAMVASTGVVMKLTRLSALAVGVALGITFVALGWILQRFLWSARGRPLARTSQVAIGLTMLAMGAYFLATMFLPAAIRNAGQVYASFIADGVEIGTGSGQGVWLMLAAVAAFGYFARGKSEVWS
jgi:predicted transporter